MKTQITFNYAEITCVTLLILYPDIHIHFTIFCLLIVSIKASSTNEHV